jgi:glycosyltransferase involved in cell wall biosynthesis
VPDLRVAFVTLDDPANPTAWSGILANMYRALAGHGAEVVAIGPVPVRPGVASRAAGRLAEALGRGRSDLAHSLDLARRSSAWVSGRLRTEAFDVALAVAAAPAVAFVDSPRPLAYCSDATFALVEGYYRTFSGLSSSARLQGNAVEGAAIRRADALIYSSHWAAASAVTDYGARPEAVTVIPFGANLDEVPDPSIASSRRPGGGCRLLFLGRDWERKGGDLAVEALLHLQQAGVEAELTVCGCVPPPRWEATDGLNVIPRLDQRDPAHRRELRRLLAESSFLLLPTRADCSPVVFCEAAAYGLPTITTATGGVTEIVRDGVNGFALPPEAGGDAYADVIERVWSDGPTYAALAAGARQQYEERLSWRRWATDTVALLNQLARR